MKKSVTGIGLLALLLIGGAVAFAANQDATDKTPAREVATASETTAAGADPVPPVPPASQGSEDAQLFMQVNQAIFEVTQEAARRPQNDRMTSEEVNELITSRIEEIKKNR